MKQLVDDVMEIEDGEQSAEAQACAMQRVINDGSAWRFQGSWGRSMMDAINAGDCMLGHKPTADYYGNGIPARDQVADGTKGSRAFVVAAHGEEWAAMLEAAEVQS